MRRLPARLPSAVKSRHVHTVHSFTPFRMPLAPRRLALHGRLHAISAHSLDSARLLEASRVKARREGALKPPTPSLHARSAAKLLALAA
mmetsp:Transcript_14741/g.33685  ORF Transcript_14741/g.33685 Transcript_14741/m.33685 type:complete len:89 (+) Transcript_14741:614-880(+)